MAAALAARTDLQIIAVDADQAMVDTARARLKAAGLYGYAPMLGVLSSYEPTTGTWKAVKPWNDKPIAASLLAPTSTGGLWVLLEDHHDDETTIGINQGDGTFTLSSLPVEAQFAPVYGIACADFNRDGNMDILLAGNFYSAKTKFGKYDSNYGQLFVGKGEHQFAYGIPR